MASVLLVWLLSLMEIDIKGPQWPIKIRSQSFPRLMEVCVEEWRWLTG